MDSNGTSHTPKSGHSELAESPSKNTLYLETLQNRAIEGGLDVGRVIDIIKRRLPIILGVTTVVIGITLVWNRTRPPAYDGSFKILIEPVTAESEVVSSLNGGQSGNANAPDLNGGPPSASALDYPTQIQILQSPKLLMPVIQKLQALDPKFSYDKVHNALTITRVRDPGAKVETKILEVHYLGEHPDQVEQATNLISQTYIRYSLSERKTNVRRALQFVDEQLPKVKTQVRNLESTLQTFREKNQLIDPTNLGSQIGGQLSNTQQQLFANQVELAKTKQLYQSLQQQLQLQPKDAEAASVLSDAPEYTVLVKQLQDIDVELQTLSADLTPDHPKITSLQEKRAKLLPVLQQKATSVLGQDLSANVTNAQTLPYQNPLRQGLSKQYIDAAIQKQVLESQQSGLMTIRANLIRQNSQLPLLSRQYEDLQRRSKLASEQLSKFLQVREDLMINAARQEVPWELISSPVVSQIEAANLPRDLALGTVLGLILGTGVALLLENLNNVIHTIKDLRPELSIPILGIIPRQENLPTLMLRSEDPSSEWGVRYRFSPFVEAFRSLNSQIRLLRPDMPIRSLVVSSSVPDEGKTTIATQLARAAAAMGQRVLLVDTDLRKPGLQNLVDQENGYGLTDVIVGGLGLMDVIKTLPMDENLHLLFAGSVTLDPTSLLGSQKMRHLMGTCRKHFDLVIYDATPLSFADALLLIPQTDGLLMVTRLGKIHRETLHQSLQTLETAKVPVLGAVVNMASDAQFLAGASYFKAEKTKVSA
jgi:polysaccharide biosynthesis transport protein